MLDPNEVLAFSDFEAVENFMLSPKALAYYSSSGKDESENRVVLQN